jgi:hypothetical protein
MKKTVEVYFDQNVIRVSRNGIQQYELSWNQINRIGYRTTSATPWGSDYFIVLETKNKPPLYYDIDLAWNGSDSLSKYIDGLKNTLLPPEGKLANSVQETSITIWPQERSGEPL